VFFLDLPGKPINLCHLMPHLQNCCSLFAKALADKRRVDVGTVDLHVAAYARLNSRRTGTLAMDRVARDLAMALVAHLVDIRNIQQPRILRAVWRVAGDATVRLDWRMLEHKGATCLGVALGANGILIGGGLEVAVAEGSMRVMAVVALHQAFIHLVMKGHVELWLYVGVALEA
jgi:hypothetical protein